MSETPGRSVGAGVAAGLAGGRPGGAAAGPEMPRTPHWLTTLRAEPPWAIGKLLSLGGVLLVLTIWWAFTRGDGVERPISRSKLQSPSEVFLRYSTSDVQQYGADGKPVPREYKYTLRELQKRDVIDSVIATLRRVLYGFGMAALIGVGLGVLAASFRALAAFLQPIVIFLRSVPLGALLPITFVLFEIGEGQKEKFILIATVPFIFSDAVKAVSLVPERYVETAQTLGASRWQIIAKVLFPLALPDIVTSLRFLFGLAFGYVMLAEVINTNVGLGYMINTGQRLTLTEQNYLLLFIIAVLAYAVDWTLRYFQLYFFHYRKDL